jgi:peptidoglycan glycosyltransferase
MKVFSQKKRSPEKTTWREYQKDLKPQTRHRTRRQTSFLKVLLLVLAVAAVGYGMMQVAEILLPHTQSRGSKPVVDRIGLSRSNQARNDLIGNLDGKAFLNMRNSSFTAQIGGEAYRVETSIDLRLQEALLAKVEEMTAKERYRSRFVGIVVMEADTGKILSMVSFDKQNPTRNACVNDQFPAASIFKIITTAAAIDTQGLTADSPINYSGQKHTLYRRQIEGRNNRYSNTLSLEKSFAQSVNPVFGEIGAELLGKEKIEDYALRFGFNKTIDFDIPVEPSHMTVGDEPFQQAEIASGFNTQTTISPLHGAMIAATVLNYGQMKTPTMVDRIIAPDGRIVYERAVHSAQRVISEKASKELLRMMQATVSSGTARKVFKNITRNAVLKDLTIGGKTGSINNNPRFDWFIGFAEDPRTHHAITVAAVVAHEEFIGERAGGYAKLAMETFFSKDFAMTAPVYHHHRG